MSSKRILIIDDEALVRRSLQRAFGSRGHDVELAVDGEEGLEKWQASQPDVVLLDVLMPKLTGLQVLQNLDGKKEEKIFLMSAYSGEDHLENTESLGVRLFLEKPFQDVFAVVDLVEKVSKEG